VDKVNFLELKNVSLVREGKFLLKNINLEVWGWICSCNNWAKWSW
jgi:ABC-type molybdenum transport system ATPase subunit/photorepair protein PhrA